MKNFPQAWVAIFVQIVKNPKNDAWVGKIVITKDGQAASTICQKCGGEKNFEKISVDGDSNSKSQAYCLNGKTCEITWAFPNGTKRNTIIHSM